MWRGGHLSVEWVFENCTHISTMELVSGGYYVFMCGFYD